MNKNIGKSLVVNFEIKNVFLNSEDIKNNLTDFEIREIMYEAESKVFIRAVNENTGSFEFDLNIELNKYKINVLFNKNIEDTFPNNKLTKKIEFEFQIKKILKDECFVTFSIREYERDLILKDFEREVMKAGSYCTSGNIVLISNINNLEYETRGIFFRKYIGSKI